MQVLEKQLAGTGVHELTCLSFWETPYHLQAFIDQGEQSSYQPETQPQWLAGIPEIVHYKMIVSEIDIAGYHTLKH
jgi:hypothetical protein